MTRPSSDVARPGAATPAELARDFLARAREIIDARLERLVPEADTHPASLHAAIRWSLFAGGKRLRPALLLAAGQTFGAEPLRLVTAACAFELVHTYSLVHDDLPAMDDDSLRRGRPTCHVRFGEAAAVLAGDALQALAFRALAEDEGLDAATRVALLRELARAAGTPEGMVAGQAHDLDAEARGDVTGEELELIHRRKTGALISAAARSGALAAGASPPELASVSAYALDLGLLFQITDDLLDVTATAEDLGKTPGKDARTHKATYPALYGIEGARRRAREACESACAALGGLGRPADVLRGIALLTLDRRA